MIKLKEVVVVEGRYDKNTLSQILEATIIETHGFGIFSDKELLSMLRRLAETRGLVVMTDSDGAGFMIRNHLKGAIDPQYVKHAYIPDVLGKEKRKSSPSREGKLGVEGMTREVILQALSRAGVAFDETENSISRRFSPPESEPITKTDLYELGLSGGSGSAEKRQMLIKQLGLPERLTSNALLEVLNALMKREDFFELFDENGSLKAK